MTAAALRHAMAEARRFLTAAEELELKGERWGREAEYLDVVVGERRELICDACLDMVENAHRAAWARHEARP